MGAKELIEDKFGVICSYKQVWEINFNSEIVKKLDNIQKFLVQKEIEKQESYETDEFKIYSDKELNILFDEYVDDVSLDEFEKEIELKHYKHQQTYLLDNDNS